MKIMTFHTTVKIGAMLAMLTSSHAATVLLNVVNGDFEADAVGSAGATGWTIAADHFWTTDGVETGGGLDPTSGALGTAQYLSPNRVATNPDTLSNPVSSFASQNIDISTYSADIDGGGVTLDVDFWYVNSKLTDERTVVAVEFFDAGSGSLGSVTTGDLAQTPAPDGTWGSGTIAGGSVAVPTLARNFTITLNQRRIGGSATNAGIDEVSASLIGVVPEPSSLALLGLGGLLLMRRRRA